MDECTHVFHRLKRVVYAWWSDPLHGGTISRDSGPCQKGLYENKVGAHTPTDYRAQELCESRGGRPGFPSLISRTVSVDVKHHVYVVAHTPTELRSCVKVEMAVLGFRP